MLTSLSFPADRTVTMLDGTPVDVVGEGPIRRAINRDTGEELLRVTVESCRICGGIGETLGDTCPVCEGHGETVTLASAKKLKQETQAKITEADRELQAQRAWLETLELATVEIDRNNFHQALPARAVALRVIRDHFGWHTQADEWVLAQIALDGLPQLRAVIARDEVKRSHYLTQLATAERLVAAARAARTVATSVRDLHQIARDLKVTGVDPEEIRCSGPDCSRKAVEFDAEGAGWCKRCAHDVANLHERPTTPEDELAAAEGAEGGAATAVEGRPHGGEPAV